MALPIKPTPKLNKKESDRFLARVESDLKIPTYSKATPKLAEARRIALNHAVFYLDSGK